MLPQPATAQAAVPIQSNSPGPPVHRCRKWCKSTRDEIILGAVVGFGFAAFESSGYALVAACTREHFLITGRLLGSYIGVSLLHALWDSMPNIAVLITFVLTGNPLQDQLMQRGFISQPTETQVQLFTTVNRLGLAVISVVGVMWVAALIRASRRTPTSPVWAYRVASYR
ncbi:MAG: protease PrsW [Pseudonocardiales bacterium]|nr:protease PrsW [Pseudonocardiales bacterium]